MQTQELKLDVSGKSEHRATPARVAVLGAGGLGMAAARMLDLKKSLQLVAIADRGGAAIDPSGLTFEELREAQEKHKTVGAIGIRSSDSIGVIIEHLELVDGVFIALPNLSNDFVPSVVSRFADAGYHGVMVDALKRTGAVEEMFKLHEKLQQSQITYITGAGATPGLLTAAANLAAQSYQEIISVDIEFGVGISNWEAYRATIREDIAHLEGFNLEKVSKMTCEEIMAELERRDGILKLVNMEHADDILLEHAGVVSCEKVHVGGVVDTRNPKKPISTRVTVTGRTFDGFTSTHTFTLGDETTMAANVLGPAFGWLSKALELHKRGIYGVFGSAEIMPKFTP
jgi:saccharopine dehydrogenase-like NADP-dependent oxidoreductase